MAFLNYHHLRYFWAIAHEGSMTRAARRLNVAASSLSVQLKGLEDQLGQKLFDRRGRTLQLTEAGRVALDYADSVFTSGDELLNTLKGLNPDQRPALRIGAVATLSRNFQMRLMRPLIVRGDVELVLRSGTFQELLGQLDDHQLDLVLANQPAMIDAESDWQNPLISDQPVSLVGPPGLKFQRKRVSGFRFPEDLVNVPLVLPGRSGTIRAGFDRLMDQAGISPVILAEVDDMALMRLFARAHQGLTLVPSVVVIDELNSGVLVEHHQLPEIREAFYAITRRRRFPNPWLAEILIANPKDV